MVEAKKEVSKGISKSNGKGHIPLIYVFCLFSLPLIDVGKKKKAPVDSQLKKRDVKVKAPSSIDNRIKLFYDLIFWLGIVFVIFSYFKENLNVFLIGMILLLLSLLIYELYHKPIKKGPYIALFYFLVSMLILYLLYLSREKLLVIFSRPFSSLLLFVLYGLAFLTLIIIIHSWMKGKKKTKIPIKEKKEKPREIKPDIKKAFFKPKKEMVKTAKGKNILKKFFKTLTLIFFMVFMVFGIYTLAPYLSYQQWLVYVAILVIILTVFLFFIYLYFKGRSKIQQKIKEIKETREREEAEKTDIKTDRETGKAKAEVHQTDFDVLYDMIQKKGKIKISLAAKIFNVNKKQIEGWAEILETHGLIRMHYPPVGEPELVKLKEKQIKNGKNN